MPWLRAHPSTKTTLTTFRSRKVWGMLFATLLVALIGSVLLSLAIAMWVSDSQLERIEQRLRDLEQRDLQRELTQTIFDIEKGA